MSMMRFSPNFVSTLIIKPLQYFFANYAPAAYKYSDDPKETKIDISSINNYNKIAIQEKPRILVDRGDYLITNSGLSDSMAEAKPKSISFGLDPRTNMIFVNGTSKILIEARNEGTCELIADMVSHFIVWTRPYICDSQGFKNFALPMGVSSCNPSKEDTEIFQVTIQAPYLIEELWQVSDDSIKINGFIQSLKPL